MALSPSKAARKLLKLVEQGKAPTIQEAVDQHPELQNGYDYLQQALTTDAPSDDANAPTGKHAEPASKPRGSGSTTLTRR